MVLQFHSEDSTVLVITEMWHLWQGWLYTENAKSSKGKCILLLKKVTIIVEPVFTIQKTIKYLFMAAIPH